MRISLMSYFVVGIIFTLMACTENTPKPTPHIPINTSEIVNIRTPTFTPTPSLTQLSPSPVSTFSGTIALAVVSHSHSPVVLLDLENGVIKDLSNYGYYSISWSPEGQWVAISGGIPRTQHPPNIFLVKSDGSETKRLTNSYESEQYPSWSPDGNFIVYSHSKGMPTELAIVQPETGVTYSLTSTIGDEYFPSWSPDSKKIAYAYSENNDSPLQLWIIDSNGKNAHLLLDQPTISGKIDWSPQEPYIAFISGNLRGGCGDIYLINTDDGSHSRLTHSMCVNSLTWSPDGGYIAFASKDINASGQILHFSSQVYIIDKSGNNLTKITDEKEWRIDDIDWSFITQQNP